MIVAKIITKKKYIQNKELTTLLLLPIPNDYLTIIGTLYKYKYNIQNKIIELVTLTIETP